MLSFFSSKYGHWLSAALLFIVLLLVWDWAAAYFNWSTLVFPAPLLVWDSLKQGLVTGYFWPHIWQTTYEVTVGLLLGSLLGFIAGVTLAQSPFWHAVLMPYLLASQVIPKLALAPLLTLWLGFGVLPMVVITALVCFFPVVENTLTGLKQTAPSHLDLFKVLNASPWQTLWQLKLPMAMTHIMSGIRIAAVLALVGAIVGEFIGANKGLGALIIAAQGSMDTPLMFAVLILITVLGLLVYYVTLLLQQLVMRVFFPASAKAFYHDL